MSKNPLSNRKAACIKWKGFRYGIIRKMGMHTISSGNYVTSVNGMIHPDRIMKEHDFLYMLDGSWEICEDHETYQMQTNDLLILPAGRHHYGQKLCNPGNRHMYLHVQPTPAESLPSASFSPSLCSFPSLLHCQSDMRIRQLMQEMISLTWSQTPERENRLFLLFSLLLCEISELCADTTNRMISDPVVEEIIRLIHATPQTFFSAHEIASRYFICERTLNNRFHQACGKTFSAFQMESKLEMVRQFLLTQPETTLREVALNYGFYDEFHLSKAFKKQFGVSPSKYRKAFCQYLVST